MCTWHTSTGKGQAGPEKKNRALLYRTRTNCTLHTTVSCLNAAALLISYHIYS
jgi:hypothetical protein